MRVSPLGFGIPLVVVMVCGCQKPMHEQVQSSLEWESDPVLVENYFSQRSRMVSNVGPDGAVSVNREWQAGERQEFYIEQQRYGADLVIGGLVSDQEELIEEGIRVVDWGFARQGPDGNFPGTGDPMHSTSFMVEGAARAALALKDAGKYPEKVKEWTPKIRAAARWMARPEEIARHRAMDLDRFAHRYYLRAAALAQAAELTGDPDLRRAAATYIEEGLATQRPDGVNPERGGFDASYQAAGIYYAQIVWRHWPDPGTRERLATMMQKGFDPLLARVQPDGSVDVEDSTRANEVGRSGKPKRVAYRAIIPALLNFSKISGDPQYAEKAQLIAQFAWK